MIAEYKSLIKNRDFVKIWISQVTSQLTIHVINFLLLIRLFKLTESTFANALLWIFYSLPALLIGPFASTLVDLSDRRKTLMLANLFQALIIFLYTLYYDTSIFLTYGVVFAYSLLNQFYVPAESAVLPRVVANKNLPEANSLFLLTQQAALVAGFGLAGILNRYIGFDTTLYLGVVMLTVAFVSVSFLPEMKPEKMDSVDYEKKFTKFFNQIIKGYEFLKENPPVLMPFLLLLGLWTGLTISIVILPTVASHLLMIDVDYSGLFLAVPAGVGAGIGALVLPRLLKEGLNKNQAIIYSLYAMAFFMIFFSTIVPSLDYSLRVAMSFISIMGIGFMFVGVFIPSQVYIQELTPDALRGRIFGNFWFLVTATTMIPVIFSGFITQLFGVRTILIILDLFILGVIYVILNNKEKFGFAGVNNEQ